MLTLVGDIHGKVEKYRDLVAKTKNDTLQIGDFGFGFKSSWMTCDGLITEMIGPSFPLPSKNKIIRGNHDDPIIANNHPNYLGDFGYWKKHDIFYISGAWSIDWVWRTEKIDIWANLQEYNGHMLAEELSDSDFKEAIEMYNDIKPKRVVSHDIASYYYPKLLPYSSDKVTRTGTHMNTMMMNHKPDVWIFGHHHRSINKVVNGCRFICLDELEVFDLE